MYVSTLPNQLKRCINDVMLLWLTLFYFILQLCTPYNEQFFIIPISLFIDIFTSYMSLNVNFYEPFDVDDKLYNNYGDVITFQAGSMKLEPGIVNQVLWFQTGGHEIKTHRCHNCVQAMWLKHSCIPGERKIIFLAHHFTLDCSDQILPNKSQSAVIISIKQKKYSGTVNTYIGGKHPIFSLSLLLFSFKNRLFCYLLHSFSTHSFYYIHVFIHTMGTFLYIFISHNPLPRDK